MTGTKKIAMFGGAAALAFAVGFGGVGVSSSGQHPDNDDAPCAQRLQQRLPLPACTTPLSPAALPASTAKRQRSRSLGYHRQPNDLLFGLSPVRREAPCPES